MIELLARHRTPILQTLNAIVESSGTHLDRINSWAPDFRRRIVDFAGRGKLIRGALVAAAAESFGLQPDPDVYRIAAVVELIQSFLLVHDDIMDEDAVRRGEPAVFEQYRRIGEESSYASSTRFGESMGICAGDVVVLIAVEALTETTLELPLQTKLTRMIASEIADVGIAQMADVANGHRLEEISGAEILDVYRYKTGRYTFSLPLCLGAVLSGADEKAVGALSEWGELQGIVFQLRDDELGIMEDQQETGKPSGSDVASGKKTMHRLLLTRAVAGTRWEHLADYFGSDVTDRQLGEIRVAMRELGVLEKIGSRVAELQTDSERVVASVSVPDAVRTLLSRISDFNRNRRV